MSPTGPHPSSRQRFDHPGGSEHRYDSHHGQSILIGRQRSVSPLVDGLAILDNGPHWRCSAEGAELACIMPLLLSTRPLRGDRVFPSVRRASGGSHHLRSPFPFAHPFIPLPSYIRA